MITACSSTFNSIQILLNLKIVQQRQLYASCFTLTGAYKSIEINTQNKTKRDKI